VKNTLTISDRLEALLSQGAILYTPDGHYPLAYAWHAPGWSTLLLLYIDGGQLVEWRLSPTAHDYDARTDKLYLAYSPKDYVQIRPGDTAEQRAIRLSCFNAQVKEVRLEAEDAALIIDTVTTQQGPGGAEERLQQMDLQGLGAVLLLLKRWSQSSSQWRAWLRSTKQG